MIGNLQIRMQDFSKSLLKIPLAYLLSTHYLECELPLTVMIATIIWVNWTDLLCDKTLLWAARSN